MKEKANCEDPYVRTVRQRLSRTLETDYGFPMATCRFLVNLLFEPVEDVFDEKLHEGQPTIVTVSADEPPGKRVGELKTHPFPFTLHHRADVEILTKEGLVVLRRTRTIKRDIKVLKGKGIGHPRQGPNADP